MFEEVIPVGPQNPQRLLINNKGKHLPVLGKSW